MSSKKAAYYLAESYGSDQLTASIVRKDNERILADMGFSELRFRHTRAGSVVTKFRRMTELVKMLLGIKKNSLVLFHFPMLAKAHSAFFNSLHKRGIQTAALIIDIDGLRYHDTNLLDQEIGLLQKFDHIIAHNKAMKIFLSSYLDEEKIHCIDLFDYPAAKEVPDKQLGNAVCFAGNFEKSSFVYQLHKIENVNFLLYGNEFAGSSAHNILYKGAHSPAALPQQIEGSFGLVWDGPSLDSCDDYLRYNNPHKFSLYIAAGMPVIVWKESALAELVTEKHIGFTVGSAEEIPVKIKLITTEGYEAMKKNVSLLRQDVINGRHLKKVIEIITA